MSGYNDSIFSQQMAGFFHESKSAVIDNKCRQDLVSKSRVLITKVPLAKAIIDVLTRGVVGSGLHLGTEDRAFEVLSSLHGLDATGELDFYQMQQQIWQTCLMCGECFLIRNKAEDAQFSQWLIAEPDHVCNPPTVAAKADGNYYYKGHLLIDGIEYKPDGRPWAVHYCITPYGQALYDKKSWKRIFIEDKDGVKNVVHIKLTDRPEYPRGLPVLAPLIETLYGLYAYQSAQIQMGIIQSCQAYIVKTEDQNKSLNPFAGLSQAALNAPLTCSDSKPHKHEDSKEFSIVPPNNRDVYGLTNAPNYISAGMSYHLGIGESIEHLATTGPSNSLTEYYDLVLSQCAAALGIPKAILSNVFDTSFSSCKASIAQWNYTISKYRKAFISQCLRPVYSIYSREAEPNAPDIDMAQKAINTVWKCVDPPLFADESKTMSFYAQAIELGLVSRDEAAMALFGHAADGIQAINAM